MMIIVPVAEVLERELHTEEGEASLPMASLAALQEGTDISPAILRVEQARSGLMENLNVRQRMGRERRDQRESVHFARALTNLTSQLGEDVKDVQREGIAPSGRVSTSLLRERGLLAPRESALFISGMTGLSVQQQKGKELLVQMEIVRFGRALINLTSQQGERGKGVQ